MTNKEPPLEPCFTSKNGTGRFPIKLFIKSFKLELQIYLLKSSNWSMSFKFHHLKPLKRRQGQEATSHPNNPINWLKRTLKITICKFDSAMCHCCHHLLRQLFICIEKHKYGMRICRMKILNFYKHARLNKDGCAWKFKSTSFNILSSWE